MVRGEASVGCCKPVGVAFVSGAPFAVCGPVCVYGGLTSHAFCVCACCFGGCRLFVVSFLFSTVFRTAGFCLYAGASAYRANLQGCSWHVSPALALVFRREVRYALAVAGLRTFAVVWMRGPRSSTRQPSEYVDAQLIASVMAASGVAPCFNPASSAPVARSPPEPSVRMRLCGRMAALVKMSHRCPCTASMSELSRDAGSSPAPVIMGGLLSASTPVIACAVAIAHMSAASSLSVGSGMLSKWSPCVSAGMTDALPAAAMRTLALWPDASTAVNSTILDSLL